MIKEIRSAFGPAKKLLRQEIICDAIAIDGNATPAGGAALFNKNRDLEREDFFKILSVKCYAVFAPQCTRS